MELRYQARAGDHMAVGVLAVPARFRAQFTEGRDPGDINDDINFAFAAAGALRRPQLVVDLILASHEITLRADALGDEVFEALIDVGDRQAALGLLQASGVSLTVGKGFLLVDALLEAGEGEEARTLFHDLEPLDKLLGSDRLDGNLADQELYDWAERALAFRDPSQILASLARLHAPEQTFPGEFDIEACRDDLKIALIRGQLDRNPDLDPRPLMEALQLGSEHGDHVQYLAALAAFRTDNDALATERLKTVAEQANDLSKGHRREASFMAARLGRLDLTAVFLDGMNPPILPGRDFALASPDAARHASRQVIVHAMLTAWLGRTFEAGRAPEVPLLANLQSRLEIIGRLFGEGRASRRPFTDPPQAFRAALDFLQHAEGEDRFDSVRWRIDDVMGEVVAAMVRAAAVLGEDTYDKFTQVFDARLEAGAGRLGRPDVRRTYAIATYRVEGDARRAEWRLAYVAGDERTPAGQLSEAALAASALATFGLKDKARSLLTDMHADGLGISRPPKKDPQYILWDELLVLACDEDPAGRPDRLRFFGRLLTGMNETEGYGAAGRLVPTFLSQAAQESPGWARAAADRIEELGLATWHDLVQGLVVGSARKRPDLSAAAAIVFGHVALPFEDDHDSNPYPELIRGAAADCVETVARHAVTCLETDTRPGKRILFLEATIDAAAERGLERDDNALERWKTELPPPRSGSSPEDPFFLARSLDDIAEILDQSREDASRWGAARAFERIVPRSDYDAAKRLFETAEVLQDDEDAIDVIAHAAHAAGRRADASAFLARLKRLAEDKGSWGGFWNGKAKQRYHRLNIALSGEGARRAAFDAFVDDLTHRRGSGSYLLSDLGDVLGLLSPRPTWAETWSRLRDHLVHFREYGFGRDLEPEATAAGDEHTLADILFRALDTTVFEMARMVRTAAVELTRVPGGQAVVAALLVRLWQAGGQHALEGVQIAWECHDVAAIRDALVPHLDEMCDSDDHAIRRFAVLLGRQWGQRPRNKRASLPAIYRLELPERMREGGFEPPSGRSATSSGLYTEDPYTWMSIGAQTGPTIGIQKGPTRGGTR